VIYCYETSVWRVYTTRMLHSTAETSTSVCIEALKTGVEPPLAHPAVPAWLRPTPALLALSEKMSMKCRHRALVPLQCRTTRRLLWVRSPAQSGYKLAAVDMNLFPRVQQPLGGTCCRRCGRPRSPPSSACARMPQSRAVPQRYPQTSLYLANVQRLQRILLRPASRCASVPLGEVREQRAV